MKNLTEDFTTMITSMMVQIKCSKFLPENMDSPKTQYYTTVVPSRKKASPLKGGNSTKKSIWNLKHEIISLKFY